MKCRTLQQYIQLNRTVKQAEKTHKRKYVEVQCFSIKLRLNINNEFFFFFKLHSKPNYTNKTIGDQILPDGQYLSESLQH